MAHNLHPNVCLTQASTGGSQSTSERKRNRVSHHGPNAFECVVCVHHILDRVCVPDPLSSSNSLAQVKQIFKKTVDAPHKMHHCVSTKLVLRVALVMCLHGPKLSTSFQAMDVFLVYGAIVAIASDQHALYGLCGQFNVFTPYQISWHQLEAGPSRSMKDRCISSLYS